MADDARIVKATLAAGIFQAVLPTVTTNVGDRYEIAVGDTARVTEQLYKKLFPPQEPPVTSVGVDRKDVKVPQPNARTVFQSTTTGMDPKKKQK